MALKINIKDIFHIILIRSGVFIAILILFVASIMYIVQYHKKEKSISGKKINILAVNEKEIPSAEYSLFIQGIKDGLIYRGLNFQIDFGSFNPQNIDSKKIIRIIQASAVRFY